MARFKYFLLLTAAPFLSGCSIYKPIIGDNIKSVHVLYADTTGTHQSRYKLFDSTLVRWDRKNVSVKTALINYQQRINTLSQKNAEHIAILLTNVKPHKYLPIKVLSLREFGYLQTHDGKVVFYGIMFDHLIDLSNDKSYF